MFKSCPCDVSDVCDFLLWLIWTLAFLVPSHGFVQSIFFSSWCCFSPFQTMLLFKDWPGHSLPEVWPVLLLSWPVLLQPARNIWWGCLDDRGGRVKPIEFETVFRAHHHKSWIVGEKWNLAIAHLSSCFLLCPFSCNHHCLRRLQNVPPHLNKCILPSSHSINLLCAKTLAPPILALGCLLEPPWPSSSKDSSSSATPGFCDWLFWVRACLTWLCFRLEITHDFKLPGLDRRWQFFRASTRRIIEAEFLRWAWNGDRLEAAFIIFTITILIIVLTIIMIIWLMIILIIVLMIILIDDMMMITTWWGDFHSMAASRRNMRAVMPAVWTWKLCGHILSAFVYNPHAPW